MRSVLLVFACLACAGHARRTQRASERLLPLKSLAKLFGELRPGAAFNPAILPGSRGHTKASSSRISSAAKMMAAVPEGSNLIVYGNGRVMCLAARLAAIRGFKTSLIIQGEETDQANELCFEDEFHPKDSIPLTLLPVSGPGADAATIEAAVENADAVIVAFDDSNRMLSDKALNVFMPESSNIKHVSLMSRYLNGAGMGFFANAARAANNPDVWNAPEASIRAYQKMESLVKERAEQVGATYSIIRAGTLKGGAVGSTGTGGGENTFLSRELYKLGTQDIVNWQLLYDCGALGIEISKGDTLPGPGLKAAWTSRDAVGDGDSHRGAVASALVESVRTPAAHNSDFSVKTTESREFPSPQAVAAMFEKA